MKISQILKNNEAWVTAQLNQNPNYFDELAKGQSPEILYIGCSDSRVTAEEMMGAKPGEVFVHRNIANIIPNNDLNVLSVINYAVTALKVKHIIVCGHYYCGGIKSAMENHDLGILNPWLRNIQDVYRLHKDELDAMDNENDRYNRLTELNVHEQCLNILKLMEVQLAYKERGLTVHGWVFDIKTGKIRDMKVDFVSIIPELGGIYTVF
jgi:carbonic anhydrase